MTASATASGRIGIGLIGATPGRGWAGMAHVPAIHATPGVSLRAVATRREATARAAAHEFDAPLWFDDGHALIADPTVDAVVVAVKAPDHYGYVKRALLAGKPVFCEMPFTHTLDEARELEALARDRGIATVVGLQGRFSPWVRQVREIVAGGRLGRILSTTMTAYDELSMGTVDQGNAYLLDVRNGANPLTIHSAHYIDALRFALGDMDRVAALTAISRPQVTVRQTGETIAPTSPDQVAVSALLADGAIASFHMRAGTGDPSFRWEIQGEDAVLRVTAAGYLMWRPLVLELWDFAAGRWERLPTPTPLPPGDGVPGLAGPAAFVASGYAAFAADIRDGAHRSASFTQALRLKETMAAIGEAAHGGRSASPRPRP